VVRDDDDDDDDNNNNNNNFGGNVNTIKRNTYILIDTSEMVGLEMKIKFMHISHHWNKKLKLH
jgi:hypothetical protein